MKRIFLSEYIILLALVMAVLQGCRKEELLHPAVPRIVELTFSGTSSVPLEFVYDNQVVDTTIGQDNSLPNPFTLNVSKGDQQIHIRRKGETAILKSYTIHPKTFQQHFGILYDEGKIYDNSIYYNLAIHPVGKNVEIFLDGKLKTQTSYGGILTSKLTIPMDKGLSRELTVKIKGEDKVILRRTIVEADSNKTMKFILVGKTPVESMVLPPLKDPKGMSLTLLLRPDIEFGQTTFQGGEVDLVFYVRDMMTEEVTHPVPEIRVTVPQPAAFATVELPPLAESKMYTFDVFKKGTKEVVYSSKNPGYTVRPGLGKYGMFLVFKDLEPHFFIPGERLICTISTNEEMGGDNFDEIFIIPNEVAVVNDFVKIQ
ncbi:hypothetical protein [Chitinophaga nivalis]|uniref:DUF5007 domain-containing protein n=1 Tax=Chitinophaga nivalis TaxID=2991709 RepID=A0ABT3IQX3_9BACT|nr:hypothetical protein [Chitinophaga nivalis]MCW3463951.1 hypothetical protein [Chitinophaga nivalis]MCW3486359.1 hypothetical protein [Chitinophaga nivalis]